MTLDEHLNECLKDPEFRAEYERTRPEFEIRKAMILGRTEQGITQKELAERTGLHQGNISRIERGEYNPNLSTMKLIAKGLGKELHVEFR